MKSLVWVLCFLFLSVGGLTGCMSESKTAMIDVNTIIGSGPHAMIAGEQIKMAQDIFQKNLNVIEEKLSAYENKEQAQAYLIEAARQLQTQLNQTKLLITQSLLNGLNSVLDKQKKVYDLIVKKDGIIYVADGGDSETDKFKFMPEDITAKVQALYDSVSITYPSLPRLVENPNLPADLGADVPISSVAPEKDDAKKDKKDKKDK